MPAEPAKTKIKTEQPELELDSPMNMEQEDEQENVTERPEARTEQNTSVAGPKAAAAHRTAMLSHIQAEQPENAFEITHAKIMFFSNEELDGLSTARKRSYRTYRNDADVRIKIQTKEHGG